MIGKKEWTIAVILLAALLTADAKAQSALEMMEMVFSGGYTKEQIQVRINRVMVKYGTPTTEENYSRLGSALVAAQEEYNVPEMDVLRCMDESNLNKYVKIQDAAGLCVAELSIK